MTALGADVLRSAGAFRPRRQHMAVVATLAVLLVMFGAGAAQFDNFGSPQIVSNLFIDNAYLLVVAVGMTFVILSGGIDLSVGSMIALSTLVVASLTENRGWSPLVVIPLVLLMGAAVGAAMGAMIHFFDLQPFVVTLAGMFFARGMCYMISLGRIPIQGDFFVTMADTKVPLPGVDAHTSPSVLIALAVVAIAAYVLAGTRFGRTVYAVGGSESSAKLMGLAVARTKVGVYTISGVCSALGGVLFAFYLRSGDPLHTIGTELDAIAAVVIGGALLTGGSGYVIGTLLGVLVLATITTLINFQGTLSSWWAKIAIGVLLLVFIVLQRGVAARRGR